MAELTKKIRRGLSVDESIQRYFKTLEGELNRQLEARWRLARVEQETPFGTHVLQVVGVVDTPQGTILRVR